MIIKYFDEFAGSWLDISGNTGSSLVKSADGWTTSQGYSVLTLLISQIGTDAPTYTELENTIGGTITPSRNSEGTYRLTLSEEVLSQGKTFIMIQQNDGNIIQVERTDINEITITTSTDGILNFTSLELRVYN